MIGDNRIKLLKWAKKIGGEFAATDAIDHFEKELTTVQVRSAIGGLVRTGELKTRSAATGGPRGRTYYRISDDAKAEKRPPSGRPKEAKTRQPTTGKQFTTARVENFAYAPLVRGIDIEK